MDDDVSMSESVIDFFFTDPFAFLLMSACLIILVCLFPPLLMVGIKGLVELYMMAWDDLNDTYKKYVLWRK